MGESWTWVTAWMELVLMRQHLCLAVQLTIASSLGSSVEAQRYSAQFRLSFE